jgi:hypothetical protein
MTNDELDESYSYIVDGEVNEMLEAIAARLKLVKEHDSDLVRAVLIRLRKMKIDKLVSE